MVISGSSNILEYKCPGWYKKKSRKSFNDLVSKHTWLSGKITMKSWGISKRGEVWLERTWEFREPFSTQTVEAVDWGGEETMNEHCGTRKAQVAGRVAQGVGSEAQQRAGGGWVVSESRWWSLGRRCRWQWWRGGSVGWRTAPAWPLQEERCWNTELPTLGVLSDSSSSQCGIWQGYEREGYGNLCGSLWRNLRD